MAAHPALMDSTGGAIGPATSDVATRALEAASVGGWELELDTGRLTWTSVTWRIHELDPATSPSVDRALSFYPPPGRAVLEEAVAQAIAHGRPYDLELPFVTARGRHIWVRACGQAIREAGRTVKLSGAFQDVTARREMTQRAERLSVVARQMTNAIIITDAEGLTEWVNDAFCRLTGYDLADLRGRKPGHVLRGPDTDPQTSRLMGEHIACGEGFDLEIVNYTSQGEPYCISIVCTPLRDDHGSLTGFIAVESDVTARRRAEAAALQEAAERRRAEALLWDVLEALPSGVAAYDPSERLILNNRAFTDMFSVVAGFITPDCRLEALIRRGAENGQYPDAGETNAERERWVLDYLDEHRRPKTARTLRLPDGRFVLARQRRSDTGNIVCIRTDTTDLKRAEEALRAQAEQDGLTLLANRYAFLRALERALQRRDGDDGGAGCSGALMVFDLDYFKQVNDTLGHDMGDALLKEVAARLRDNARRDDVAARLGGDEFAVVMPGLTEHSVLAARMTEIQSALAVPVDIGGRRVAVTISAGVTLFPQDGSTAEQLFKNADLALYEAKRMGRARWAAFRPDQAEAMHRHVRVADSLRQALATDAVTVAFQPKRLLRGGHAGFETLARWHDGTRWVPPGEFVPVAEETGQIVALGRAVLEATLARMRMLADHGLEPGRVAINVSGAQLLDGGFVADTMAALARHGFGPADLEMEVTETVLLGRAAERVEKTLREIRGLGIALALDDFGTGYASLAHLSRLPIDRLKIDRAFVAEIGLGGRGGVIARTVIGLARSLEMESVAEGVETAEQLAFLAAEGCDAAQGYLIARPLLSYGATEDYLRAQGLVSRRPPLRLVGAARP